ncbi:MAG: RNA polymerase factor sigma-54 [Bacteroidetes bacterium]|jgi:RNA polymerase sigma-54 factor|nr:RNA polymerase factor sigma-54 [Bacteroidota bacterium]
MLKQGLQQSQTQKLSPQQIQFIKLLQLNSVDILQRIDMELIENPALLKAGDDDAAPGEVDPVSESELTNTEEAADVNVDDFLMDEGLDVKEYVNDEYDPDGFHLSDEGDEERKERPLAESHSFHEELLEQFTAIAENDKELTIGNQIIGSIDDDGYLRRSLEAIINDLAFSMNVEVTIDEMRRVLHKIQNLEPAGIGATSLQECLLLQLKRKEQTNTLIKLATQILSDFFDDFTKKHYERLTRMLKLSDDELRACIQVITRLNPKPGESIDTSATQYITPDFILIEEAGKLMVHLNSRNAPDLRISRSYLETLKGYDEAKAPTREQKDTVQFIKQKLDGARWFIDSIRQRHQTLLATMNAILKFQYRFFVEGDETFLKPMILKDIAEITKLDISTISRVANSKYVQTDYGTFPLKYFFSEGILTDEGEEVSSREVKKILKDAIEGEEKLKPLPDERLMEILKEKGYNIARRTVAKYREQMNIPVARLRKEI